MNGHSQVARLPVSFRFDCEASKHAVTQLLEQSQFWYCTNIVTAFLCTASTATVLDDFLSDCHDPAPQKREKL